jgi:hypothetical protein
LSRLICKIDKDYNKSTVRTTSDGKVVILSLIIWLGLALLAGFSGWFRAASAPIVAGTVWTLTALALVACWIYAPLRRWLAIVDLRVLISLHLVRFVAGIYFLIDYKIGILSADFAVPAATGDIIVASLAGEVLALLRSRIGRAAVWAWNVLGLVDILFVVVMALRVGLRDWPSMAPLRELPLSLLPTFIVPLIIASHVLIFVRLTRPDKLASN